MRTVGMFRYAIGDEVWFLKWGERKYVGEVQLAAWKVASGVVVKRSIEEERKTRNIRYEVRESGEGNWQRSHGQDDLYGTQEEAENKKKEENRKLADEIMR